VNADTVHVDATLIRADVSWDSITTRHIDTVIEENDEAQDSPDDDEPATPKRGRPQSAKRTPKKFSPTDPDATMATSCRRFHLEPTYKQHTAVEDSHGVIVDVAVTTGEVNEGKCLLEQLDRVETKLETRVQTVTCDAAYAHGANYARLEQRGTDAIIPPQKVATRKKGQQRIPARRFKYDEHNDCVRCPSGKPLHSTTTTTVAHGTIYTARASDCRNCPRRPRCISPNAKARKILIGDGYTALLRARRRKEKGWDETTHQTYVRHRWRVEGVHGRAKSQHGLRRATQRGIANVRIQAYLTAAAMNLKSLAQALYGPKSLVLRTLCRLMRVHVHESNRVIHLYAIAA
jgi:hypothetical protein